MELTSDLVVLGAGPGGYTAAFRAADLGMRVTLVERDPTLGGVCLNVGCIPSKALLHAAKVIADAREIAPHGISFGKPVIDLPTLRGWKDRVVGQLTHGLQGLARQRKVEVVTGEARFAGAHTLSITTADGSMTTLRFGQAIIAAGSQPVRLPGLPYEDPRVIDSTGALALTDIPGRLLVIGGGIIGLEMATVYAELGSAVTVVELSDGLMPGADRDLVKPLEKRLKSLLAALYLKARVSKVTAAEDALVVGFEGEGAPAEGRYDRVLVAVGRRPNGQLIDAEKAGIEVDARGFIKVDHQMRTQQPHIFAIGDIVGNPMLAHKATHEGKVAAEVAAGHKAAFDARVIPSVAYTDPEIAWVGMTETEAAARGIEIEKAVFPWAASGRALSNARSEGLTKLIFDKQDKRVIGAGIVGTAAGDLIAEATLAIELSCDAEDIGLTIHPHPTLSETVAMAAEMFSGTITDLYVPRKRG
jgi:dihydrolipoamide dehydrogenase